MAEKLLPAAVRDLLRHIPAGIDEWDLFLRLSGEEQPLWEFLVSCVAEDDTESLRLLATGRTPLHDVLEQALGYAALQDPVDAPFVQGESAPARALRAHASLGLALVGDADEAEAHLRVGLSWLRRSAAAARTAAGSEPDTRTAPPDSRHGERLTRLLAGAPAELRAHLCLVLLALDAGLPKILRGPRLTVLAERGDTGSRFQLRLDLVRGLPAGLLPHPRVMSAFFGDEGFRGSLEDAWQTARPPKLQGAVLWSLWNADGPVDHVSDSSFGAALAVLLTELGRTRTGPLGPLRLRRANPRTSVIGAVSAANPRVIESVTGYESKLRAVEDGQRVVVPRRDAAEASRHPSQADVVGAVTVEDAAKVVRRLDPRATYRLGAVVLSTLLVGSLLALVFTSGESRENNRRAEAAGLAAQAVRLSGHEPRKAGLLALAGHEIDPKSKEAEDAVQEVLEANRNTVRSWVADQRVVSALAVDDAGHRAYTSGADDVIRVWDTRSGHRLAEVKGRASELVRGTASGVLVAVDGRDLRLYDTTGDRPEAMGEVKAPSCTGQYSEIVGVGFTSNGSALTTVFDDGAVATVDPASLTVTRCTRLRDVAGKELAGRLAANRTAISADLVSGTSGPDGADDEAVLLLTTNEVVAVNLRTRKVSQVVPADKVPGDASLVQASHDVVTLATDGGVLAWDRAGRSRIAYPLGALPSRPTALEQDGDDVVIAGKNGTAVVPVQAGTDSGSGSLSVPTGGRSVAAVRAGDGTVVAAGDNRVTVLGNHPVQRALPSTQPSTGMAFGSGHTLALTDFMTNASYGAYTIDLDAAPGTAGATAPSYDPVTDYPASASYINDLAMSDKFVAAAGQSRGLAAVTVWKRDGTYQQELLISPDEDRERKLEDRIAAQVAFVPGARLLVARNAVGDVAIWSTKDWRRLGTLPYKSESTEMAIHGTTGVFTEGSGKSTRIVMVDLVTRRRLRSVAAPDVVRLSMSSDGSRLVALSWVSGSISVLDGRKLTPVRRPLNPPAGELVQDVALSPDGRLVAFAMGDHVLVHNLRTGQQAMPQLSDTGEKPVVSLEWSPDGAYLSGLTLPPERENKRPGGVDIWKMAEGSLTRRMCDWAGGGLSRAEWKEYVDKSVGFIELCEDVTE
ncbi:WD40 repeat domain-containing protein [Streptomyces griseoluteus]|uniref:WD40 repeat domain-containing protein n=1 Tax=Streptomyces griseoluteus TaxID=29306 RepID=UPI0033340389